MLLEADDFRWRFGYKGDEEVIWEGTFMVTWVTREGGMRVERMEWVVHDFTVVGRRKDTEEEGSGSGVEIGVWGFPDMVFEVLKVSSC